MTGEQKPGNPMTADTDALRLVSVEPTKAMIQAGVKAAQRAEQTCVSWPEMVSFTYRAMLAAAPQQPAVTPDDLSAAIAFMDKAGAMLGRGEMPAPGSTYAAEWYHAHATILSALRAQPPARDNRICRICDGGSGNEGVCLCGEKAWEQPPAREDAQPVWVDGVPTKHHAKEWFIAETTFGDRVVLTALPEEYDYDFKTADETYIKADRIKRWMPFPDSQYLFPHPTPGALRRAVGALEKIKLQSEDCLGQRMETITAIADQALAALQPGGQR